MATQVREAPGSATKLDSTDRPSAVRKQTANDTVIPEALQDLPPAPWTTIKLLQTFAQPIDEVRVDRVVDDDDHHSVSFRAGATLTGRTGEHRVCYETQVSGSGEFEVLD